MKTIGIIGPGAIGCLFAASMKRAGHDVTLMDKHPDRASRLNETGIIVKGAHGDFHARVPCIVPGQAGKPFDLVLICVKAYDTEDAIRTHRDRIHSGAAVMTLQNGFGNTESIIRHVPEEQTLAGITSQGANSAGIGIIHHAGIGDTFIGELNGRITERLTGIKTVFDQSGFDTNLTENVEALIFTKLLINTGINAITGILRLRNGRLAEFDETRELMKLAVTEGLQVAKRKKLDLDPVKIRDMVEQVARKTGQNRSSMLMDILRQRKTEVDFINGAIVKLGRELGVETPVNTVILHLVRTIEQTYALRESL